MMSQQSLMKCDVLCDDVVLTMEVKSHTPYDDCLARQCPLKTNVIMLRTSSGSIFVCAVKMVLIPLYEGLNSA